MNFKNTKPTASDFFRKYSDLVTEAEKAHVESIKFDTCKKCKKEPCVCGDKKTKSTVKESSNLYQKMMGESTVSEEKMGFAKVEKAVAKNPKVKDPAAVAASIGRKKLGQKEMTKRAVAGKKKAKESIGESKQINEWVENPAFDELWKKYVPSEGEGETPFAEAIRALGRLEYDYYNNGYGNARDVSEVEHYDDDADDDEREYHYVDDAEDIGFTPFYQNLWNKLDAFVRANNPTPELTQAVNRLDIPSWDNSPSPKFQQAVGTLKNFLVSVAPKNETIGEGAIVLEGSYEISDIAIGGTVIYQEDSRVRAGSRRYKMSKADSINGMKIKLANGKEISIGDVVSTDKSDAKSFKIAESNLGISQGGSYETSADFESDVSKLNQALLSAKRILNSPEWNEWMKSTDTNFNTPMIGAARTNKELALKVAEAQKMLDNLYSMLSDLS